MQKTINSEPNNVTKGTILICEKRNWDRFPHDSGKWLGTKWTIRNDKIMICEAKYDSCSFINMKARKEIKETILNDKSFKKLKLWIRDVFSTATLSRGCDGTGWNFTSFDENGKVIHSKVGYIYDDLEFETLLEILNEKA